MHSQESSLSGTCWNEKNRDSHRNHGPNTSMREAHADKTTSTAEFTLRFATITGSLQHVGRRRDPLKRNKRSFISWMVKLNNAHQLIVEGTLECGRRARTKPIAERLSALKILSKFKHTYYLVGDMADSQYELPGFVRHRFHAGFPQDWKIVVGIWKSFVTSESNAGIRSRAFAGLIVEKKLKLAIHSSTDSQCFMECPQKVNQMDSEMYHTDENFMNENIRGYWENGKQGELITDQYRRKFAADYKSQDTQRFKTINGIKQLIGWTPFVLPDKTVKYHLVFKGTLLSSMGHAVNKTHLTDAVHRRLSPRIIETVNQEFYELIGDINNTKHDVPQELATWCRYGCPKEIHSFCEKWRILRNEAMIFQKRSAPGEMKIGQDQSVILAICHENSVNMTSNGRTNPLSLIQPVDKIKKRKRIPMEVYDNCSNSDTSVHKDTTCNKKPGAISSSNSWDKNWPKIRRKRQNNLPQIPREDDDIAESESFEVIEQIHSTATCEKKQRSSPLKQEPVLSYVYLRCAPVSEGNLSDGV